MNSHETDDGTSGQATTGDGVTFGMLQEHQRAWEDFAAGAVHIIPALKAQMVAVTNETERAAMELLVQLRILSSADGTVSSRDKSISASKVVMAVQFQDATRQKLEHVCLALDQLQRHLHALLKGPRDECAKKEIAVLRRVEHVYTREEERRLHEAAIRPDYEEPVPTDVSGQEADSVTLF
ncbi:MAG: hypothetical protein KF693_17565 [Nitrospira sp.]|nr:hypothetical protein [Nitrospira sp.]